MKRFPDNSSLYAGLMNTYFVRSGCYQTEQGESMMHLAPKLEVRAGGDKGFRIRRGKAEGKEICFRGVYAPAMKVGGGGRKVVWIRGAYNGSS